jgi:hypothetical protein
MSIVLGQDLKNLEDYKEMKKLGQGACGEVFFAQDFNTGEMVAIKKIVDVADARDQRCFIREIGVPLGLPAVIIT